MGFEGFGGGLGCAFEECEVAEQSSFGGGSEQGGVSFGEVVFFDAEFLSAAPDRAASSVCVLSVEDGIVVRLSDGGFQVEIERRVGFSGEHEESHGVFSYALQERAQVEEGAAALRHFECFSVFYEAHDLTGDDGERRGSFLLLRSIMAGFEGGLQA